MVRHCRRVRHSACDSGAGPGPQTGRRLLAAQACTAPGGSWEPLPRRHPRARAGPLWVSPTWGHSQDLSPGPASVSMSYVPTAAGLCLWLRSPRLQIKGAGAQRGGTGATHKRGPGPGCEHGAPFPPPWPPCWACRNKKLGGQRPELLPAGRGPEPRGCSFSSQRVAQPESDALCRLSSLELGSSTSNLRTPAVRPASPDSAFSRRG